MQISNRSLLLILVAAVALVGAALWLALRPKAPPTQVAENDVMDDVILDEPPDVNRSGGIEWKPEGPVEVFSAENTLVKLECDGLRKERRIREGKATFDSIPPAGCDLMLHPDGEEEAPKVVPFYPLLPGDVVTCRVERKEIACDGSLAEKHAATMVAWSQGPGMVKVDGEEIGPVPIEDYKLPVGRHRIEFVGRRARSSWTLTVSPDEFIEILFHSPARDRGSVERPSSAKLGPRTQAASP